MLTLIPFSLQIGVTQTKSVEGCAKDSSEFSPK